MNILFVCTENTDRSVVAEELCRMMARELEISDLVLRSAGTDAVDGLNPSFGACAVIADLGNDNIYNHLSRSLNEDLIEDADLILTMTKQNLSDVLAFSAKAEGKAYTILNYTAGSEEDIEDPFGGDSLTYQKTLDKLELALAVLLLKLYPEHEDEIRSVYGGQNNV